MHKKKLTQQPSRRKENQTKMKRSSHIFETYKRQGNNGVRSISICIEDQVIKSVKRKDTHIHKENHEISVIINRI
jgi:hypothetical protein